MEVLLTVSTTLMAVAALSSLVPKRIDSGIVLTLFAIQFGVSTIVVCRLAMPDSQRSSMQ